MDKTNYEQTVMEMQRWAVITGASSGIGEAFARRLSADGYALILVARRRERLEALATELTAEHKTPVEVFPADLSQPGDVQRVAERISACKNLALLVNNAGFGLAGRFWEADVKGSLEMTQVHVAATVQLTRAAVPVLMAQGEGGIINVSSIAAFVARGSGTMYHATKAFINAFSQGLAAELRGSGVKVQALCPGFTTTEFHDTPEYRNFRRESIPRFLWMTPAQVVDGSLADLRKGKVISIPGVLYQLIVFLTTNSLIRPFTKVVAERFVRRKR